MEAITCFRGFALNVALKIMREKKRHTLNNPHQAIYWIINDDTCVRKSFNTLNSVSLPQANDIICPTFLLVQTWKMDAEVSETSESMFDALRNDRLAINVGGVRHSTFLATMKNIPNTRLSWIAESHPNSLDYDPVLGEYFFDRHPRIFEEVLNYYRTGKLHCPVDVCYNLFAEELSYWGVLDRDMEPCCWVPYQQQINTEKTLNSFPLCSPRRTRTKYKEQKKTRTRLSPSDIGHRSLREIWQKYQPSIWAFLDDPRSSIAARVSHTCLLFFFCRFILPPVLASCKGKNYNVIPHQKHRFSAQR